MNQDELYSRIREFLEEQKKYLESTGGVSKIIINLGYSIVGEKVYV